MPIFEKQQSRIKMLVLRSGKSPNITWFSILSKDYQNSEKICRGMLARFTRHLERNPGIKSTINQIHFYEKGKLIGTVQF